MVFILPGQELEGGSHFFGFIKGQNLIVLILPGPELEKGPLLGDFGLEPAKESTASRPPKVHKNVVGHARKQSLREGKIV